MITLLIILLITCGGTALSYLYEKEDSLLVRLAAGNVTGSAIFATIGFLLACFFGLSTATVLIALAITLLPVALLAKKDFQRQFKANVNKARGKLDGANLKKVFKFAYYLVIFLVLWFFFERAMIETTEGILTGGSQNLGDLPFHLGAIFSFTDGSNFPPANPSFANAKFTYPFLADFVTACFVKVGAGVREAMLVQNVFLGFSLVVLLEKFTFKLTNNKLAGKIAPLLLLFSGGLGFLWFFKDYWNGTQSFFAFFTHLPNDYTIGEIASTKNTANPENFRWGNSLVVLFLTQRSLLFGMPLTLIALTKIWDIFTAENAENAEEEKISSSPLLLFSSTSFLVGILAGTLPLIHVHSLAALFVVCAILFFFSFDKWKEWTLFAVGVSIIAVPELLWSLTGSATNLSKFIEIHFGWDAGKQNIVMFWAKNIGLFAPLLVVGLFLIYFGQRRGDAETRRHGEKIPTSPRLNASLLIFYIPFAFLFLISNTLKLAPWEWDNIKVLIYWFVGSLPFAAFVLAWAWEKTAVFKLLAAVCFGVLTLSGGLDVWRTISGQIKYQVFSKDAVKVAELIKQKTAPGALFLNAPTYNSAVVLSGRRSLMRYSGHLSSYGIDYEPRESEVKKIYEGTALADKLLQKNNIEYVIISPEETGNLTVKEEFFYKFQIIAEVGAYKVFKVK